jgi:hypothetical protein
MKKTVLMAGLLSLIGSASLAQVELKNDQLSALNPFVGIYRLVDQNIQTAPNSNPPGICDEEIVVSAKQGSQENGCDSCGKMMDIFGLPEGSGRIVVQLSNINEGVQSHWIRNVMTGVVEGRQTSESQVLGDVLSHRSATYDNFGNVLYSKVFRGQIDLDVLKFEVANFRQINGFEESTVNCTYKRK